MFNKVDTHPDFPAMERRVLELWRDIQAFDKLRKKNRGREKFSFVDGPI